MLHQKIPVRSTAASDNLKRWQGFSKQSGRTSLMIIVGLTLRIYLPYNLVISLSILVI